MKAFRNDSYLRFIFQMAEQQRCKVSSFLGLRPNQDCISHNELIWWQAYYGIKPMESTRMDIMEGRIVGVFASKSPHETTIDWFDNERDPEWRKARDLKLKEELEELEARHKAQWHDKLKK